MDTADFDCKNTPLIRAAVGGHLQIVEVRHWLQIWALLNHKKSFKSFLILLQSVYEDVL